MDFFRNIILIFILIVTADFSSNAEKDNFEGYVSLEKRTCFDTLHIHYYIKNNKVRINHYNSGNLIKSLLAELKEDSVIAIDPERKMYKRLDLEKERSYSDDKENLIIIKTGNHKTIKGTKCYQWRVKDRERNSEIAYWVASEDFDFMHKLIGLLSQTDKIYHYFSLIPNHKEFFPFVSVERTLVRKEKQRIILTQIERKDIDDDLFEILSSYIEFKH
ncbi:MAG: DUF4412 domain-containing protein [Bacteroidales bacterium]